MAQIAAEDIDTTRTLKTLSVDQPALMADVIHFVASFGALQTPLPPHSVGELTLRVHAVLCEAETRVLAALPEELQHTAQSIRDALEKYILTRCGANCQFLYLPQPYCTPYPLQALSRGVCSWRRRSHFGRSALCTGAKPCSMLSPVQHGWRAVCHVLYGAYDAVHTMRCVRCGARCTAVANSNLVHGWGRGRCCADG